MYCRFLTDSRHHQLAVPEVLLEHDLVGQVPGHFRQMDQGLDTSRLALLSQLGGGQVPGHGAHD
jgi:hypothetical protein